MSIHDGHRTRMRQRFIQEGLEHFAPHEVLELLLYYTIPRGNTNEMAHELIQRYKTIGRVLRTSPKELQTFAGVGENTAFFLNLLNAATRYIYTQEATEEVILTDVQAYGRYLVHMFQGMTTEAAYLVCMDAKSMVLGYYKVSEGSAVSTNLPIRKIVDLAITSNAVSVILAHNHPGGFAIPSQEDKDSTLFLANILNSVDVVLVDHIVFSGKDYISLLQQPKVYTVQPKDTYF